MSGGEGSWLDVLMFFEGSILTLKQWGLTTLKRPEIQIHLGSTDWETST